MDKFKLGNIEFEIEHRNFCDDCAYDGVCKTLKNPSNPKDDKESFMNFCSNKLTINQMPKQGTLEKNLPWIFPENKILTPVESINQYCSNFCPYECQKEQCPLYIYKTK